MKPLIISTGKAADGEDKYFERKNIETKIWSKVKKHENLLLAAPRRTGKSSILKYLQRVPQQGYIVKYISVQSVDSINEYFKKIYTTLLDDDNIFNFYKKYFQKTKGMLRIFASKIRGISTKGIEIDPEKRVEYYSECINLLKTLPNDFGTILFLIDEFPDAVRNISIDDKKKRDPLFTNEQGFKDRI